MEKGFYWMAVGLLLLGVNQTVVRRHGDWVRVWERNPVEQLAQLSHQTWTQLQGHEMPSRALDQLDQLDRVDTVQADFAAHSADLAQRRAEWMQRRLEMANRRENRRSEWIMRNHARVLGPCAGQDIRVNVPPVQIPAVHVTVSEGGTI